MHGGGGGAVLDRFRATAGDARRRGEQTVGALGATEPLRALPGEPHPATLEVERVVGASTLVAFRGNRYSISPGLVGARITLRQRLGDGLLRVLIRRQPRSVSGAERTRSVHSEERSAPQSVRARAERRRVI